jgi:prophage regulatory protein
MERVQRKPAAHQPVTGMRILRIRAVLEKTGLGRTHLKVMRRAGKFPAAIKLTDSDAPTAPVGWLESEIDAWIAARAAKRGEVA